MDDIGWLGIRLGLSGATVRRSADGRRYRKSVVGERARTELMAERDRLIWLADIGFPAARVLDWGDASRSTSGGTSGGTPVAGPVAGAVDCPITVAGGGAVGGVAGGAVGGVVGGVDTGAAADPVSSALGGADQRGHEIVQEPAVAVLVTSAVPGVPISSVRRSDARVAARSLALLLRDLHAIPVSSCRFDRTLAVTVPAACAAVAVGVVDAGDFDEERTGLEPSTVLEELLAAAPRASVAEPGDLVVCHGDACLPNVLVDPETLQPTGIVDVGRLGVADRHQDLALATRSLADPDLNPAFGPGCADAFLESYLSESGLEHSRVDPDRLAFYRLLDEFF